MVKEIFVMFKRSMRHIFRSMDTIITVCITPIAIMLLFSYVLGGAIETEGSYINYILPGVMLITIGSGIAYVAYRLYIDKSSGMFERFRSLPISRITVLWGHVLTSLVSNGISVIVVILVALSMGFRSSASLFDWLIVFCILGIFALALTWIAVISGLVAKSPDGAGAFSYLVIFLPFISSAFVPTDTMPFVVRTFAENQPVTYLVEAIRNLLSNQPIGNSVFLSLVWCIAITIVASICALKVYNKC